MCSFQRKSKKNKLVPVFVFAESIAEFYLRYVTPADDLACELS
jgi:hypothetical protein